MVMICIHFTPTVNIQLHLILVHLAYQCIGVILENSCKTSTLFFVTHAADQQQNHQILASAGTEFK